MAEIRKVQDMMGREVEFNFPPQRIVSLVPSQTEFLLELGAPVVGRTKFCIHPANNVEEITVIGGTKQFRLEAIDALKPDLIIGNKEENYQEGIKELERSYPVWMSDIYTLADTFEMMAAIGHICDFENRAHQIIRECQDATNGTRGTKSGKVIYLIWKNPWMAAGRNTFIDHMLTFLGYENVVTSERYPELTDQQISDLNPEQILFSSEPFPFKTEHIQKAKKQWPEATSQLVDGELFSWYGSRLKMWEQAQFTL